MAKILLQLKDFSDEKSGVSINIADLADIGTWDAQEAKADAFATHVAAHSRGTIVVHAVKQDTQASDNTRPADPLAQREAGIRFYLRDNVTDELSYFTIGTGDWAVASNTPGNDLLDLSVEPTAAFVTWLEANAVSDRGNPVTVERALTVGRNA